MKKPLHKIFVVCLLMIMALPMLSPILHQMQKWEIREYMTHLLKERKLQTVSVAAEHVVWMDKHEIWVNEQMFDIVSATIKDGIYLFTGLYDEGETAIVKKQMSAGKEDAHHKKDISNMVKWLLTPCLLQDTGDASQLVNVAAIYPGFTASLYVSFTRVSTPPPRNCFTHIT